MARNGTNGTNGDGHARTIKRCAVYTRKSSEEGLEQEFNSLDAQRESGEAFIASQRAEGWVLVPERFDDGGYTGGNMERPALKRLMTAIDEARVDCVVVYKVDRLSRSLLDFARMMESFERRQVSFVSVTQQFNTSHSMGRLMLNVLLSFAQFEREIISERTRDKIAATRRKGKWSGGRPILGYDVDAKTLKLVVNEAEAAQVREIFGLYLANSSLIRTVEELASRGWTNKLWTSRKGKELGGRRFDKTNLYQLLMNPAYAGRVRYKDEVHAGEQVAIIEPAAWQEVNDRLRSNGRAGASHVRNRHGALLKGLLVCAPCGCAMAHTFTTRGVKAHRYYVCTGAQKSGWKTCPTKSLPASQIEEFVVKQIRDIGRDPALIMATLEAAHARRLRELQAEEDRGSDPNDLADAKAQRIDRADLEAALAQFDGLWSSLSPAEQARVLQLLIERVEYDRAAGKVSISFRPSGVRTLGRAEGVR